MNRVAIARKRHHVRHRDRVGRFLGLRLPHPCWRETPASEALAQAGGVGGSWSSLNLSSLLEVITSVRKLANQTAPTAHFPETPFTNRQLYSREGACSSVTLIRFRGGERWSSFSNGSVLVWPHGARLCQPYHKHQRKTIEYPSGSSESLTATISACNRVLARASASS